MARVMVSAPKMLLSGGCTCPSSSATTAVGSRAQRRRAGCSYEGGCPGSASRSGGTDQRSMLSKETIEHRGSPYGRAGDGVGRERTLGHLVADHRCQLAG